MNIARVAWCFSRVNLADDELYDGLAKNALVSLRSENDLGDSPRPAFSPSAVLWTDTIPTACAPQIVT